MSHKKSSISLVVPVYNEAAGLGDFHRGLLSAVATIKTYEIIYSDDGSSDETPNMVRQWHAEDSRVRLLRLSRNFGKEAALTAGIAAARGDSVLTLDGDGQHPVELINKFVQAWQDGAQVVVGVRTASAGEGWVKRLTSRLFYAIFNRVAQPKLIPRSTDFRLIDRQVQQAFLTLPESNRMTRAMIDWLGFERKLIYFKPKPRTAGPARYSYGSLFKLAANSFVSLTSRPLYIFGYLGLFITVVSFLLGTAVGVEQFILHDPLQWRFTGTALLAVIILFLVGIVLLSQGVLSLYVAHLLNQSKGRPLYVIDTERSAGLDANAPQ